MIKNLIIVLCFFSFSLEAAQFNVDRMRELFELVNIDEKYYVELDNLTRTTTHHNPIAFGYRGLYYFMRAKYIYWPNQKLSAFNTGKQIMEALIILNPKEPELRLIRYSVQYNVPRILGYDSDLSIDKKILVAAKKDPKYRAIHYLIGGVLSLYP